MVDIERHNDVKGVYLQTIACSSGEIIERLVLANGKVTIIQYQNGKEINRRG